MLSYMLIKDKLFRLTVYPYQHSHQGINSLYQGGSHLFRKDEEDLGIDHGCHRRLL